MEERRKYIRFSVPLKAEVIVKATLDTIQPGTTKDFSREGLRLILHKFDLGEGSVVDLRIYLPSEKTPIPMKAKIIWAKPNETNWEVGLKIKEVDKEAKSKILDYAYNFWRKNLKNGKI